MNLSLRDASLPGALEGSISQMEAVAQVIRFKTNLCTEQSTLMQRWQSQLFSQGEPSRCSNYYFFFIQRERQEAVSSEWKMEVRLLHVQLLIGSNGHIIFNSELISTAIWGPHKRRLFIYASVCKL